MKIYMVIADNGKSYYDHDWWNVAAFTSYEAAQEHIQKLPDEIRKHEKRMDELEELQETRGWTQDEGEEWHDLLMKYGQYWHFFDHGEFRIEEHEILN